MKLACDNVEATTSTQVRKTLSKEVIDQYHEDLKDGAIFPAITVFSPRGSDRFILADGFHRLLAHIHAEIDEIEVEIKEGGMHDALMYALGANTEHGLRRSNADKNNAVRLALKDPEISQMTQQQIADICRVTRQTVNRIALRNTLDENEQEGVTKLQQPEENTPENIRPSKAPPTQTEIEREELRQAMSLIKAFPYSGADSTKLDLDQDDIKGLKYVSDWYAQAVLAHPTDENDDRSRQY